MANKISITDFSFDFKGHGHYEVTYTSPVTLKSWSRLITDMAIIDSTKNCEDPRLIDLEFLKSLIKRG